MCIFEKKNRYNDKRMKCVRKALVRIYQFTLIALYINEAWYAELNELDKYTKTAVENRKFCVTFMANIINKFTYLWHCLMTACRVFVIL